MESKKVQFKGLSPELLDYIIDEVRKSLWVDEIFRAEIAQTKSQNNDFL